jgi:peptide/nickel transport system permease protein
MSNALIVAGDGSAESQPAHLEAKQGRQRQGARVYVRALAADPVALSAAVFLTVIVTSALLADFVAPYAPDVGGLMLRNRPPMTIDPAGGVPHILGTDALGRDVLSRLIYGARVSLSVGLLSVLISGTVGVLLGLVAGYFGGLIDDLIMRTVDLQMGFPSLLTALIVLYVLGASIWNVILVLAITRWMIYARITRGLTLTARANVYVEAAQASGCDNARILFIHILPNLISPIIVLGTLEVAAIILAEASLSFLGLGIQPPDSSWGLMLAEGRNYITVAWWLVTFPGLAILLTTLALNLLAAWVRVAADPVTRWRIKTS